MSNIPYDQYGGMNAQERLSALQNSQRVQPYSQYGQQYATYPQYPYTQMNYQNQQNVPQSYSNNAPAQTQQSFIECNRVTNADEARAVPPKWDGSSTISVDSSNKRIYEKKLNMNNGSSIFNTYVLLEEEKPVVEDNEIIYDESVSKKDFNELKMTMLSLAEQNNEILDRIGSYENLLAKQQSNIGVKKPIKSVNKGQEVD